MTSPLNRLVEKKMGPVAKELQEIKREMVKQTKLLEKILVVLKSAN